MSLPEPTKRVRRVLRATCFTVLAVAGPFSQAQAIPPATEQPRHVILLIGDGMDDQQITIA